MTTRADGRRTPVQTLLLALGVLGHAALTAEAQVTERPAAVTDSAVVRGEEVFSGTANCVACHGEVGEGTAEGPSLIDDEWLRGSGTYEQILDQVLHGTPRRESKTGRPMPMRGWIPASDADVRAVAAYVWMLSHRSQRRDP